MNGLVQLSFANGGHGHVALDHHLIGQERSRVNSAVANRLRPERMTNSRVWAETEKKTI